ncbi:hypothetical protein ES703_56613 [subsurface metagenome]
MARKLDPEVVAQILELRSQGLSYKKIALELKVSSGAVRNYSDPRMRKRLQRHRRQNWASVDMGGGKRRRVRARKRPRPAACELCNTPRDRLNWHHWDDDHLEWGLWLCQPCHMFAEGVDRGLEVSRYLELKDKASHLV